MKYENRKTGEIATVVSTDEKAKTVMLEKANGKTVVMSVPSLRKSWKKVEEGLDGTVVIDDTATEPVVEEVVEETAEKPAKKVKKEKVKKEKISYDIEGLLNSKLAGKEVDIRQMRAGKPQYNVKVNGKQVLAMFLLTRRGVVQFAIKPEDFEKLSTKGLEMQIHETWALQASIDVAIENVENVLDDVISVVLN